MKKRIYQIAVALMLAGSALFLQFGCESTGTPVTSPLAPTSTTTSTFTASNTFTNTPTIGSPTNTPTITATPTATVPHLTIFDDSLQVATGESEFDGGGAITSSNLADTSSPYEGSADAIWVYSDCGAGMYAGWNVTGPSTDLSAYTTLSFWAKVNRAYAGNGIEFFGGGNSVGPNQLFALTTSYQHYSYTFAQPSTTTTIFFGTVINTADVSDLPGSGPLTVYVDDIQYQ